MTHDDVKMKLHRILTRLEVIRWSGQQLTSAVESIEAEVAEVVMAVEGGLAEELPAKPAELLWCRHASGQGRIHLRPPGQPTLCGMIEEPVDYVDTGPTTQRVCQKCEGMAWSRPGDEDSPAGDSHST